MSLFVQYLLVFLVLLVALGLFIVVSMKHDKKKQQEDGCEETNACSTCAEGCTLKKEILEKSAQKRLQQSK
ncbi:MAG: hypothetical protein GXY09_00125 [Bacteroidales bacterium]|nr:hypothetical protein [Bacteroidales bacterium]